MLVQEGLVGAVIFVPRGGEGGGVVVCWLLCVVCWLLDALEGWCVWWALWVLCVVRCVLRLLVELCFVRVSFVGCVGRIACRVNLVLGAALCQVLGYCVVCYVLGMSCSVLGGCWGVSCSV